jgi:hypothetical protein
MIFVWCWGVLSKPWHIFWYSWWRS